MTQARNIVLFILVVAFWCDLPLGGLARTVLADNAGRFVVADRYGRAPIVDGDLADWDGVKFHTIVCGRQPTAAAALAHDRENLYLAYRVTDASPLMNRGQDPLHHFKEGDAVDLMFGPARDGRTKPVAGDLRLLLVPAGPVAVLYRQVWPGGRPVEFSSPVRRVTFDSVEVAADVAVKFVATATGYVCEARVPLATLGVTWEAGRRLAGDLGVLLSNDGGLLTVQRCNLFHRLATTVSDIPTEVELTPGGWGEMEFE